MSLTRFSLAASASARLRSTSETTRLDRLHALGSLHRRLTCFGALPRRRWSSTARSAMTLSGKLDALVHVLLEKLLHARPQCDRRIHARIAAALIRADGDEVAMVLVGRERLAEAPRQLELLAR